MTLLNVKYSLLSCRGGSHAGRRSNRKAPEKPVSPARPPNRPDRRRRSASVYVLAHLLLKQPGLAPQLRTAAALLPVPFFLLFLFLEVRRLDELEQRVQLEALAFAFPGVLVALLTLGLLQVAGTTLSPDDWNYRDLWLLAIALYVLGVGLARRRYR